MRGQGGGREEAGSSHSPSGSYEHESLRLAQIHKLRVLGQKSVTRVDGLSDGNMTGKVTEVGISMVRL